METKVCKVCGRELPITEFKKTPMAPNGIATCNKCCGLASAENKRKKKENREPVDEDRGIKENPSLKIFSTRTIIEELRARGYSGTLTFKKNISV